MIISSNPTPHFLSSPYSNFSSLQHHPLKSISLYLSHFLSPMEILPVKSPNSGISSDSSRETPRKISYTLETKNLSYELTQENSRFFWQRWWHGATGSGDGGGGATGGYILRNVNCVAKPGEILAIAGPSGAGKSTLLEVLAGRIQPSRISGRILVNRQEMDVSHFRRVSGYVTQDDELFPLLTVEETLMYSARLRLSGSRAACRLRVRALLKELGLEQVAGSRIGDENVRGISGGEKRRVSIGVDVVHDPAVLLLDEPTSGLDSASALQVVSLLKSMAEKQGRTIILSIHQPGFRILELVDKVLLLAGGCVVHHGSMGLLKTRLKTVGHCIPKHVNVLEFAIDAMETLVVKTQQAPTRNDLIRLSSREPEDPGEEEKKREIREEKEFVFYANSPFQEVLILSQRFCKNIIRTKQLFTARTVQAVVAGFGLGTIFMNASGSGNRVELQERVGFFAFSLTFLLSSTTEGLPIFLQERRILTKETSRGAYRVSSYVAANTLIFIPFLLMVALLYSTPVYWLVGLRREFSGFLYFALVVWMAVLMANSFVACFSALVPNFIMGNSLIAGFMGSFFLFSGYFISKNSIPKYWIFMHYMSLFKYPFEAFLINEYGGRKEKCVEVESGGCILSGAGFLVQQGLRESQKWSNLGVMVIFICGYRLLCLVILWYRCSRTRK